MSWGKRVILAVLVPVALAGGCGGRSSGGVSLAVNAGSPFLDAPAEVIVRGLPPRSTAILHASWTAFRGHVWSSSVRLRATSSGVVRLRGVDGMRFLWGMRPTGLPFEHPFFLPPATGPSAVRLSVSVDGDTVARAVLSRRVTPPSVKVRKLTLRRDGVVGVLFTPTVSTHRPAAVAFGGSEGGDTMVEVAGVLAAHGYPALSLAYFGAPGLPPELVRIPLEYFARAVRLLDGVPSVDPAHVVVMGDSRGGEAALLLAATFPRLIHGAIGLVPSASVYPAPAANLRAWTLHGTAVPLEQIPVERITGPVLTVGAGDDQVWSSAESVNQIEHRLVQRHFRFRHEGLIYPRAGHAIGGALPYLPVSTQESGFGGTPRADTAATADLWPHILSFFAALRRS